jgi:integrase/recombinase XerD
MDNQVYTQKFMEYLKLKGNAPRTIDGYRTNLNEFLKYLQVRNLKLTQLTRAEIQEYQADLYYREFRGKPLNIATQGHRLTSVRMLFKFLAAQNLVLADPAASLELPKEPARLPRNILTAKEAKKILESIDTTPAKGIRDRAIIETLYSSGIRATELINLTLNSINLKEGYLSIEKGKGGKPRIVPLGKIACHWVGQYLQVRPQISDPTLFFTMLKPPRPLRREVVAEICSDRAKQAGIKKKVTSHTFRHTCATLMLKGWADIRYVQELLGHASLKTTQIYTKVTIVDLKKVHNRCHPGNRP